MLWGKHEHHNITGWPYEFLNIDLINAYCWAYCFLNTGVKNITVGLIHFLMLAFLNNCLIFLKKNLPSFDDGAYYFIFFKFSYTTCINF